MNARRNIVVACSMALVLQGCATASKDLTASYVSPLQYQSFDCDQLRAEAQRIQSRVVQLGGRLDEAANNDKGIMAVGLILFWPVLFALGGTKAEEAEYSRLKGEYDALEQQAIIKKCPGIAPSATTSASAGSQATAVAVPTATPSLSTTSAPAPVADPPAAQVRAPAPVAAIVQPVSLKTESKYMFLAERFAKDQGCTSPVAAMTIKQPDNETFTVSCASANALIVRCEGSACRTMQ